MNESDGKTDWQAFALHFVFGVVVGAVIGLITISRRRASFWMHEGAVATLYPVVQPRALALGDAVEREGSAGGDRVIP